MIQVSRLVLISVVASCLTWTVDAQEPHCPGGWDYLESSQKCYQQMTQLRSWDDSRKSCKDAGGDLVTIRNGYESEFLSSRYNLDQYWIGFNDKQTEGQWKWLDNTANVSFTHWFHGEPNNAGNEDCAYALNWKEWNDAPCGINLPGLCERPAEHQRCPQGWNYLDKGQKCYQLTTEARSWDDSRNLCKQAGGDLATIRNGYEDGLVSTFEGQFWIGFNDKQKEGHWTWLDETELSNFTQWYPGEPNNSGGNEDCAYLIDSQPWNDAPCGNQLNAICERPAEKSCSSTSVYHTNAYWLILDSPKNESCFWYLKSPGDVIEVAVEGVNFDTCTNDYLELIDLSGTIDIQRGTTTICSVPRDLYRYVKKLSPLKIRFHTDSTTNNAGSRFTIYYHHIRN